MSDPPAANKQRNRQNMTLAEEQAEAEEHSLRIALTIYAALESDLYRDLEGGYCINTGNEEIPNPDQFTPVSIWEWASDQIETSCLYDFAGDPAEVSVLIGYGGPTITTKGDLLTWGHGFSVKRRTISGLNDALLQGERALEVVERVYP